MGRRGQSTSEWAQNMSGWVGADGYEQSIRVGGGKGLWVGGVRVRVSGLRI